MRKYALMLALILGGLAFPAPSEAGWFCALRDAADHACRRSPTGVARDAVMPNVPHLDVEHHDSDEHESHYARGEYAVDPRARAPHSRAICLTLQVRYVARHGLRKPEGLRRYRGCRLWRLDADYHH